MKLIIIFVLIGFSLCHNSVTDNDSDSLIHRGSQDKRQVRSPREPPPPPPGDGHPPPPPPGGPHPPPPPPGDEHPPPPPPGGPHPPPPPGCPSSNEHSEEKLNEIQKLVKKECHSRKDVSEHHKKTLEKMASILEIDCPLRSRRKNHRRKEDSHENSHENSREKSRENSHEK